MILPPSLSTCLAATLAAGLLAGIVKAAEEPPPFLTMFGRPSQFHPPHGPAEFFAPYDIEIDSQGNLYIADAQLDRIQKFDRFGTFLLMWGSSGDGAGQFDQPMGVAVGPGDEIFVVEKENHRVQVFDSSGNYLREWGEQANPFAPEPGKFFQPQGIDVDVARSFVYVADTQAFRMQKFSLDGTFLTEWAWTGTDGFDMHPMDVAVEDSGDVLVLDHYAIFGGGHRFINRFSDSGTLLGQWGTEGCGKDEDGVFCKPRKLAVDSQGDVYVTDTNSLNIQKFTPDGTFLWRFNERRGVLPELGYPHGVAVESGILYVVDWVTGALGDAIQLYGDASFGLAVDVPTLAADDLLTLRTFAGEPGKLAMLFITEINGAPFTQLLAQQTLDADGHWTLDATVPSAPDLTGITLGLQAFSTNALGFVSATNAATISFQ